MDRVLNNCEIKEFLRSRQHLLAHFSTVMGRDHFLLPDDLLNAMKLAGASLSFSTVTIGDTGPFGGPGGAEGAIGMRVDVGLRTAIERIGRMISARQTRVHWVFRLLSRTALTASTNGNRAMSGWSGTMCRSAFTFCARIGSGRERPLV
jgi:hypothetical protein